MRKGIIHVGTSGWQYKHWTGTFYPPKTKPDQQLGHYLRTFKTVELNNSFYHLPDSRTFKKWASITPERFVFSVKGSRYITHMKKLSDVKDSVKLFIKNASGLGEKLGPILFQLPPGWQLNIERLSEFLALLPRKRRFTFEFRNSTWYDPVVLQLLAEYNCAFCIYELNGHRSPDHVSADFVYVRLHGPGAKYQGSYPEATLRYWADRSLEWQKEGKDVFIYFDNDQAGYAAFNARDLIKMTGKK